MTVKSNDHKWQWAKRTNDGKAKWP